MRLPTAPLVSALVLGLSWQVGCSSGADPGAAEGGAGGSGSGGSGGGSGGSAEASQEGGASSSGGSSGGGADAAPDAPGMAMVDAQPDALPPGSVSVGGMNDYMVRIANGAADSCTHADGHELCGGSCNGSCAGSTADSTYTLATGTATPSLSGASTLVSVSGESTDTLEWVKLDPAAKGAGAYASDTHFTWSLDFYPTALTDMQAYEFDLFDGSNGWWLMMGSQCDLATGNWNGWDEATGHWIPSSIDDCGSFFQLNQWNHVVFRFHRDAGPVTGTTRYYYDSLEVNGVSHAWGLSGGFTGSDNGWGDVVGVQVQQDLTSSFSGTLRSYYDDFTLTISP